MKSILEALKRNVPHENKRQVPKMVPEKVQEKVPEKVPEKTETKPVVAPLEIKGGNGAIPSSEEGG